MGLHINFNLLGRSPFGFGVGLGLGHGMGFGLHLGPVGFSVGLPRPSYMFPMVEAYPFSPVVPFAPMPYQRTYGPALDLGNPHSIMDWMGRNNPYHDMMQSGPLPPPPPDPPQQPQAQQPQAQQPQVQQPAPPPKPKTKAPGPG